MPAAPQGGGDNPMASIEGNRNPLNKGDALATAGRLKEQGVDANTPLSQVMEALGFDLSAPGLPQLQQRMEGMMAGSDPITQTEAIGGGLNPVANPGGLSGEFSGPGAAPPGPGPGGPPPMGGAPPMGGGNPLGEIFG